MTYIAEATWAHDHGLSSTLEEFDALPAFVHDDVRLLASIEAGVIAKQRREAEARGKR